jgi:anti-sigma factor RsiW
VTCSELIDAMLDYCGEELDVECRETFELHLRTCDNCTFYLESYRHTVTITRKMTCAPLRPEFAARLRAALKDHLPE